MTRFCPHCGAPRGDKAAFCATCGERLDAPPSGDRRRRGNHSVSGAVLVLLGGGSLFAPLWPSSLGNISIWQSHDQCSSLLGSLAPGACSTVTLLWAAGLGLLGLGVLVLAANLLRSDDAPRRNDRPPAAPRSSTPEPSVAPTPMTASRAATPPTVKPTEVVRPAPRRFALRGAFDQRSIGLVMALVGVVGLAIVIVVLVSGWGSSPDTPRLTSPAAGGSAAPPSSTSLSAAPSPTMTLSPTALPVVTVDVPVIACATTYGGGELQQPTEPFERRSLPAAAAGRLAVFATNVNRVMAPREWRCVGEVGVNGSAGLTVSPGVNGDVGAIILEDADGSYGYALDLACPLFPEAARLNKSDFDQSCPTPPEAEVMERVGTIARFMDGSGVAGTGTQSGGAYPATGAIRFIGAQGVSAAKITCLLPFEDQDLCAVIVDDWLGR